MSLAHDLEDSWFHNEILKNQITELNKQLKQKDAEIEKRDDLLREAVELIENLPCNDSEDIRMTKDFLKKMEQK